MCFLVRAVPDIEDYTFYSPGGRIYQGRYEGLERLGAMAGYSLWAAFLAAGAGVCLLLRMLYNAARERISYQTFWFPDFPESFGKLRIFFISDIHKKKLTSGMINHLKKETDLVIIGGDLREGGVPLQQAEQNVRLLKELGPVYFVWGNNDYEGNYHDLDAMLLDLGITILDNAAARLESEAGEPLWLLGVDDLSLERADLRLSLGDAGTGFKILVTHNPLVSEQVPEGSDIRLILAGHTHGGQIRIFGFGPYKHGGVERSGAAYLLTSNGHGTTSLPLRLGALPETHLITLEKGPLSFSKAEYAELPQ